jgi:hypothetical protein
MITKDIPKCIRYGKNIGISDVFCSNNKTGEYLYTKYSEEKAMLFPRVSK